MKTIKKILCLLPLSITLMTGCESFTDINNSVSTVYEVDPLTFLYKVQERNQGAGSTWTDSYACKLRWLQYCSNIWGYSTTNFTYFSSSIGSDLYSEWLDMGGYATHIEYYISKNMPEELPKYSNLIEVARILLINKGIATTDMHGSLAYTEGWGLRRGRPELENPKFDTQEELFTIWDQELKTAIEKLSTATDQVSLAGYDMAFKGDVSKWIKTANALRLRIALRMLKRNETKAKEIAAEVLKSSIPASTEAGVIIKFDKLYTNNGDWHSVIDMDRASAPFMRYLKTYNDPRKRIYFRINNLTSENIAQYNSEQSDPEKLIPADFTQWEGGTVSYDERKTDKRYFSRTLKDGTDMRAMNQPQVRLWKGMYDNGSGGSWFPNLTYADFCFMASEFSLLGVSNAKSAQQWYEEGVAASLKQWSAMGEYCKIYEYEPITDAEINDFLSQPGIAWNAANALEQIYCQSWVEHYKNTNEAWALWRRTGYPNQTSTIVTFDKVMINGEEQTVPRRTRFAYPAEGTPNKANMIDRIEKMAADVEFGEIQNEFGRLWWDKK